MKGLSAMTALSRKIETLRDRAAPIAGKRSVAAEVWLVKDGASGLLTTSIHCGSVKNTYKLIF